MRHRRSAMLGMIFVVAVLVIVMITAGRSVRAEINEGNARIAELQEETEAETKRTEEIKTQQENIQSDESKEQIAKEKLGMIKDNEIIFKEAGSDTEP